MAEGDRIAIAAAAAGVIVGWPRRTGSVPEDSRLAVARTVAGPLVGWRFLSDPVPPPTRIVVGRAAPDTLVGWRLSKAEGTVCFTVAGSSQLFTRGMFTMSDGAQVVFWHGQFSTAEGYAIRQAGSDTFDTPVAFSTSGFDSVHVMQGGINYKRSGDTIFAMMTRSTSTGTEHVIRFDYAAGAITVTDGAEIITFATDGGVADFYLDDANGLVHLWSASRTGSGSGGDPYIWHGKLWAVDQSALTVTYTLDGVAALDPIDPVLRYHELSPSPDPFVGGNDSLNANMAVAGSGDTFFLVSQQANKIVETFSGSNVFIAALFGLPTPQITRVVAAGGSYTSETAESGVTSDPTGNKAFTGTPNLKLRAAWADGDLILFSGGRYASSVYSGNDANLLFARTYVLARSGVNTYGSWDLTYYGTGGNGDQDAGATDNCVQAGGRVDLLLADQRYDDFPMYASRVGGTWSTDPSETQPNRTINDTFIEATDEETPGQSWYAYSVFTCDADEICTAKIGDTFTYASVDTTTHHVLTGSLTTSSAGTHLVIDIPEDTTTLTIFPNNADSGSFTRFLRAYGFAPGDWAGELSDVDASGGFWWARRSCNLVTQALTIFSPCAGLWDIILAPNTSEAAFEYDLTITVVSKT